MKARILSIFTIFILLIVSIAPITAQDEIVCEDSFRLFEHDLLSTEPTCIPESPQKVAPLDLSSFELMLIAGMKPAVHSMPLGGFVAQTYSEWLPVYQEMIADTPDVGFPYNLEAILIAEPDLILLMEGFTSPDTYPQLAEIAPLLVFEYPPEARTEGEYWEPIMRAQADALGIADFADEIIADYDARIEALSDSLGDTLLDGDTVSVVRIVPPDQLGLRLAASPTGVVLNRLGVAVPPSQAMLFDDATGFHQQNIGRESWRDADGDYLIIYGNQPPTVGEGQSDVELFVEGLADDPIWNALSFVQEERVLFADPHWHGFSVISAHAVLDDLFTWFTDVDMAEIAPNPMNPDAVFDMLTNEG